MKIINHDLVLDGIDKQILDHLVENAREPILEITRNIGAFGASVLQRVRKMEEVGIISSCDIIFDLFFAYSHDLLECSRVLFLVEQPRVPQHLVILIFREHLQRRLL